MNLIGNCTRPRYTLYAMLMIFYYSLTPVSYTHLDVYKRQTYCCDLARLLVDMCETEKYGYYHATNEGGYISWYDFCVEFYKQYGLTTKVIPVTTEEYGLSKAARPMNSRLDKSKLVENGFTLLPTWQDAVKRYIKEL